MYIGLRSPVLFLYRCNFKIRRKATCITANPIVIEIGISKIIVSIIFDRSSLQKTVKDCCTKKAQSTQNKDSIDTNIPYSIFNSFCANLPQRMTTQKPAILTASLQPKWKKQATSLAQMDVITNRIRLLLSGSNVLSIASPQSHYLGLFLLHEALERIFKIFVFSLFSILTCC